MENRMRLDRRHWLTGLKAAAIWVRNPVSEYGATQVAKIQYSLLGPTFLKEVEEMRAHPIGKRLLAERPAMDAAIDMDALSKLPDGSFGKTLHDVLDFPDTIPGLSFLGNFCDKSMYSFCTEIATPFSRTSKSSGILSRNS